MSPRRRLPKPIAYAVLWDGGHDWSLDKAKAEMHAREKGGRVVEVQVPSRNEDAVEKYMRRWFVDAAKANR